MKLKINKACDLNSISVLPPHTRRSSMMPQPRSQPSQQSFSQGFSSQQNGIFSQISQTSVDDVPTDNQRFSSQEKDLSVRRLSCLAPREESQMPLSRNSSSLTRRWNSTTVPEHKCQLSDELEHKISVIDTSLNRLGMILDSVQADIMRVNKGTKELSLEVEGIHQKSIAHHDSLNLLNRSQEEIKTSLESISNLLTIMQKDKNQETMLAVSTLQEKIDFNHQKRNDELSKCLSRDLKEIMFSLKTLRQKNEPLAILPPKMSGGNSSSQKPLISRKAEPLKVRKPSHLAPKIEMGRWTAVKVEQTAHSNRNGNPCNDPKQRRASMDKEQNWIIDLDDETDGDFSCFIVEKKSDNHLMVDLEEDTARILREARRRKRKRHSKRLFATHRK